MKWCFLQLVSAPQGRFPSVVDWNVPGVSTEPPGGGSPTAAHSSVTEEPAVTKIELEGLTIILGSAVKGKHKGTDTVWNYKPVQESNVFFPHITQNLAEKIRGNVVQHS